VDQFELGHGVDGVEETNYLLASLGLEWTDVNDPANTTNLPELVDGMAKRVSDALGASAAGCINDLVARIAEYGSPTRVGYDHRTMAATDRFSRRFRLRFARGYNIADNAIRLLSTDDMRARPFIDADSLYTRVNFPDQVRGDVNPVVGLANCARRILGAS
jgi:hypothetical protein